MLTLNELINLLSENYTPEELIDILGLTTREICENLEDIIEDQYDILIKRLTEEVGYALDD
jgi:hypothetical protein